MMWDLPFAVEIDGKEYKITNKCDYRMALDVISALNDSDLDDNQKIRTALYIFYEDISDCDNIETAIKEMYKIIAYGENEKESQNKPQIMDWEHDFRQIAPPVSRVLGYDVRTPDKYTHWYTFIGAYMEIGECMYQNVISIRKKRLKGKKLENWEQEFYKENKKMVDLPKKLSSEDEEFLYSDW